MCKNKLSPYANKDISCNNKKLPIDIKKYVFMFEENDVYNFDLV